MEVIYSVVAFIVAIGILVTIHEFGHFWVARRLGVKVLRFSVGFGKPLWSKTAGVDQTEYVIASIPLGGYVKMLDEREGDVAEQDLDRAFNRKSLWRRMAIVVAGPAFNFLFAIFAYYLIYLSGVTGIKPVLGEIANPSPAYTAGIQQGEVIVSVNNINTPSWQKAQFTLLEEAVGSDQLTIKLRGEDLQIREKIINIQSLNLLQEDQINLLKSLGLSVWRPQGLTVVDEVIAGGAGEAGGMLAGDKVVAVNGVKITSGDQWVKQIRNNPGLELVVKVMRQQSIIELIVTPREQVENGQSFGLVGVRSYTEIPESLRREMRILEEYGPIEAFTESIDKTWRMSWLTLKVLGKLVTGEASVKNLSGPITIAKYAGVSARIGLESFLGFLAIISISLGVLNLLPVPMLDGGHLFYYFIELFKGSPVSEQTEIFGQKVGMVILFCLMSIAIFNDISRLVG
ncbi:MAG: regulator of sigma E protease [Planctomycetota bacterium]